MPATPVSSVSLSDYSDDNFPLLPKNIRSSPSSSVSTIEELLEWRVLDRVKTVAAGLLLCLNLGVDPPDACRPNPCARWECWIDPISGSAVQRAGYPSEDDLNNTPGMLHVHSGQNPTLSTGPVSLEKTREAIARNLLQQYEQWQSRVRYKTLLDPTVEEVRKLCLSLRKSARNERVLLHYNGHGVPKPTRNGEFWVFNKQFTQYIPVNVADVASWVGFPSIWILDCPAATFLSHALQKSAVSFEFHNPNSSNTAPSISASTDTFTSLKSSAITSPSVSTVDSCRIPLIVFTVCDSNETLPLAPAMPADILTSCLTTPLDMAIRWHSYTGGPLLPDLSCSDALKLPGKLTDRRTPLGELNWIFTAITDTIAWLVLPRDLFRRLYRQDLLIASLSRNFLLAQRILKSLFCTATSIPSIPATHQHPFWTLWDHTLDSFLMQIPVKPNTHTHTQTQSHIESHIFKQSTFFPDQLDAFDLWLRQHQSVPAPQINGPPDQLPSALQVLLSQNLRPRALSLLARFCDFGPWACLECLHVGIHPYILKLLQTSAQPAATNVKHTPSVSRPLLHIWTRLFAVDPTCKNDLLKDSSFLYFVNCFIDSSLSCSTTAADVDNDNPNNNNNDSSLSITTAATLATFFHDNPEGRSDFLSLKPSPPPPQQDPDLDLRRQIFAIIFSPHRHPTELLWRILLLSQLWDVDWIGSDSIEFDKITSFLSQFVTFHKPEIRAAIVYSVGTLISDSSLTNPVIIEALLSIILPTVQDPSPLVRLELLLALQSQTQTQSVQRIIISLSKDPFHKISSKAASIFEQDQLFPQKKAFPSHFLTTHCLSNHLPDFAVSESNSHSLGDPIGYERLLWKKYNLFNSIAIDSWKEHHSTFTSNSSSNTHSHKFDTQIAVFEAESKVTHIAFHPLYSQIYSSDAHNNLTCWNWDPQSKGKSIKLPSTSTSTSTSSTSSSVSSLSILPLQQKSLLLSTTQDGHVHLHSTLSEDIHVEDRLCSAFSTNDKNLLAKWSESDGGIYLAGSSKVSFYDPESETISTSHPSNYPVTFLFQPSISTTTYPSILLCGTSHGTLDSYDFRTSLGLINSTKVSPSKASILQIWELNEHLLLTATSAVDSAGTVQFWDRRKLLPCASSCDLQSTPSLGNANSASRSAADLNASNVVFSASTPFTSFSAHPKLPGLFAYGSPDQCIKLCEFPNPSDLSLVNSLQTIRYHDGFLAQRLGPISAVQMHPERLVFGTVSSDNYISIYKKDSL